MLRLLSEGTGPVRLLLGALCMMGAIAIGTADGHGQEVSGQQRRAAAEAYDRGTSAWLAGQYSQAAQWFETAHRLAPSSAALVQAIRSHQEAGNTLRAASLALWLKAEFDDDPRATKVADKILTETEGEYAEVTVDCDEECSITIEGKVQEYNRFFVQADVEHELVAGFEHGDRQETVEATAGETVELTFEAPEPPPEPEPGDPGYEAPARAEEPPWPGLPKWVTITAMGLTLGLAGTAVWSGVDTLNANDTYEEWASACETEGGFDPNDELCVEARDRFENGQDLERRTNILIGAASGMAVLSAALAIFATDWSGSEEEVEDDEASDPTVTAGFSFTRGGGMTTLEGRF